MQSTKSGCRIIPASLVAGMAALMALAQQQQQQPLLRPIDQRLEGANQLATSLRTPFTDLRLPLNFDRLYEVESSALHTAAGVPRNSRLYARASAGLIAVFPRTENRQLARGVEQVGIPPGTIYLFADSAKLTGMNTPRIRGKGSQPSLLQRIEQPPIPQPALQPDTRPTSSIPVINPQGVLESSRDATTPSDEPVVGPTIWKDETLRQTRISALIDRAFKGG